MPSSLNKSNKDSKLSNYSGKGISKLFMLNYLLYLALLLI